MPRKRETFRRKNQKKRKNKRRNKVNKSTINRNKKSIIANRNNAPTFITDDNKNTLRLQANLNKEIFTVYIYDYTNKTEFQQQFTPKSFPNAKLSDIAYSVMEAIDTNLITCRNWKGMIINVTVNQVLEKIAKLPIPRTDLTEVTSRKLVQKQHSLFNIDMFSHDDYFITKEIGKVVHENILDFDKLATAVIFNLSSQTRLFFYYPFNEHTLLSFHHIEDNKFNFETYCEQVLKRLNSKLHGKWEVMNDVFKIPFQIDKEYKFSDVAFHQIPTLLQISPGFEFIYTFTKNKVRMFVNKYDQRNQVFITYGKWQYDNKINKYYPCIIVTFIDCQYTVNFKPPLDYRCHKQMNFDLPSCDDWVWCLYYDFRDKERCLSLTPRLAYKIFQAGCELIAYLTCTWVNNWSEEERFPDCCKHHINIPFWKESFIAAIERVLFRLTKGIAFSCDCTAEEMAVHMIIEHAHCFEVDGLYDDYAEHKLLPNYGRRDKKYEDVRDDCLEDHDVLMLFDEKLVASVTNHKSFIYRDCGMTNLHPSTWYLSFRHERFNLESIKIPLNEGTIWTKFWLRVKHPFSKLMNINMTDMKYNGIDCKQFVGDAWKCFTDDFAFVLLKQDICSYPLISIALNCKLNIIDNATLDELCVWIKSLRNEKFKDLNELVCILMMLYRMKKKEYFVYLATKHDLFKYIINAYYHHLVVAANDFYVLYFYCIVLSIMAKQIYHDQYYSDSNDRQESKLLMNWLEDISFENMEMNRESYNVENYLYSLWLRAPITCFLNKRIGIWNSRYLYQFYRGIVNSMKCFNTKCEIKSNNKQRLKVCKNCCVARYCSKRCQKIHWKMGHNNNCKIFIN